MPVTSGHVGGIGSDVITEDNELLILKFRNETTNKEILTNVENKNYFSVTQHVNSASNQIFYNLIYSNVIQTAGNFLLKDLARTLQINKCNSVIVILKNQEIDNLINCEIHWNYSINSEGYVVETLTAESILDEEFIS